MSTHPILQPLGTLARGSCGRIASIEASNDADRETADRLREIGFSEDLRVEVLHMSPFGKDPIAVKVGNMTVAVRRADANLIMVEGL